MRTIPKCIHHYIEDETTGLQFFRKLFPDIVTIRGKDNYKKIGIHNEPTLFIFDRCGFGNVHEEFLFKYGNYDWLYLLDYESLNTYY